MSDHQCPICFGEYSKTAINNLPSYHYITLNPCCHTICCDCMKEFMLSHDSCPLCKKDILTFINSSTNEETIFNKPVKTQPEEEFQLYTNNEFRKDIKSYKEKLLYIKLNKYDKRNFKSNSEYEINLFAEIEEDILIVEALIDFNTSQNHFDKNKDILEKLQNIHLNLQKYEKGLSKEEIRLLDKRNDNLYSIEIPVKFEKIKKKKDKLK